MRALIVAVVLLIGCAGAAQAEAVKVTQRVWAAYQEYLKEIGSTRPGAFAIAQHGDGAGWQICPDIQCSGNQRYKERALTECREFNPGVECIIFAQGREIVVEYEVAE